MKRVLNSLFAFILLFAGWGTVYADTGDVLTTLSQISSSKAYTIAAPLGGLWLNPEGTGICSDKKQNGSVAVSTSTLEGADQWAILTYDGVSYYLYNVAKKRFLNASGGFDTFPTNAMTLSLASNPTGDYVFKITNGTNTCNNNNSGSFVFDSWSTEDNGNRLTIVEAGDFDPSFLQNPATLTWTIVDGDGNTVVTDVVKGFKDFEYTSNYASINGVTLATPTVVATGGDQKISSTYTVDESKFPFKFSSSFADATWYQFKLKCPTVKYCQYDGSTITNTTTAPTTLAAKDLFALVGTPFGFKVYNYEAGADAPFGPASSASAPDFTSGAASDAATMVFEYSTEAGYTDYQLMRYADNPIGYLNDKSNKLGVWLSVYNRHDGGSNFEFVEVPTYTYAELQTLISQFDGLTAGTTPGYYTDATLSPVLSAVESAKAVGESAGMLEVSAAYTAIADAAANLAVVPITDGYYILYSDNSKIVDTGSSAKAMYTNATKGQLYWGEYVANDPKFVFKLTKNEDDTWTMQNMADGLYAGASQAFCGAASAEINSTYTQKFTGYPGTGSFYIKSNNWTFCPQGNPGGNATGPSYVWGYNGEGTAGGNVPHAEWTWRLSPVSQDSINAMQANALANLIEGAVEVSGGNDPGCYSETSAEAYNSILADAANVSETGTDVEKAEAYRNVINAPSSLQINPITEGYYFITSAGKGSGHSGGPYDYEDKNALYNAEGIVKWKAYSDEDKTLVYKITPNADGNWDVYNVLDSTYINRGTESYNCNVTTTAEPTTSQKFVAMQTGSGKFAMYSVTYAYAMNASHNGSAADNGNLNIWGSTAEAKNFGINQWFLHAITAEQYDELFPNALKDLLEESLASLSTITPANHHDNTGTRSFLLGNERTSVDSLATSKAALDSLQAAYDVVKAAYDEGKTEVDIPEAYQALLDAKAVVDAKSNPLVDGYYHLIAEYGDDTNDVAGGFALQYGYDASNPDNLYKRPYVTTEPKQMFKVEVDSVNSGKIYLQNVASGKYLGLVSGGKWIFTDTKTALNFVSGKDYYWYWLSPKNDAARSCSFILTDDDANGIQSSVSSSTHTSAVTGVSTSSSAWTIAWAFRPADEYYEQYEANKDSLDFANTVITALSTPTARQDGDLGTNSWINGTERTAVSGYETTQDKLDSLQTAWDAYLDDPSEANKALVEAAVAEVNKKWVPLTDGVYYMIPRFGDDQGNNNTQALTYVDNAAWKKPMVEDNTDFMFKVTITSTTNDPETGAEVPATMTIMNIGNGKYLGAINGTAWEYQNDPVDWSYTTFVGSDFFSDTKHAHCYGLNIDGKFMTYGNNTAGSAITTTTGGYAWYKAWMFRPVPNYVEEVPAAKYYEIAADPSVPQSGKSYAIKNAFNSKYLVTGTGTAETLNVLSKTGIWTIEETTDSVDNVATFILKSEDKDGYWQYIDYASQTFDATTPYDGYDWFGYAGLNAACDAAETAHKLTILDATSFSGTDSRSCVAEGKEPSGYVLTAKDKVMDKFYKLGVQGTNVALEPYNEDVAWLFYEATPGTDFAKELELALAAYYFDTSSAATGTDPGYYIADNFAEYNEALSAAQNLDDNATDAQYRKCIDNLAAAYAKVQEVNPIVEGYYTIVSAGKGTGYYGGSQSPEPKYDDEDKYALYNADGVVKWKVYDGAAYDEIYYISPASDGNFYVKSFVDGTYINRGTGTYGCDVTTSAENTTSQTFELSATAGKFTAKFNGNPYVYSLTATHNGAGEATTGKVSIWGGASEANKFGMNLWFLHAVSDATINAAQESVASEMGTLIAQYKALELDTTNAPGYYVGANVRALVEVVAYAEGLTDAPIGEKLAAVTELKAAYNKAISEYVPITEGYYYMVSKYAAYADNFGASAAMYTAATARFEKFDENNANFIFKITPKAVAANAFDVQNAYTNKYLNTGNGTNWYGEITTVSDNAENAQLFSNYGVGQFWVADETDTRVSRCVRKTGVKNGTIYGWTTIADNIAEADKWYNAWALVPVASDAVDAIIAAQRIKDAAADSAYKLLTAYVGSIKPEYDAILEDETKPADVLTALRAAMGAYDAAKAAIDYDITSDSLTYANIQEELENAMAKAGESEIIRDYWQIADEPSVPEAGKTYVMKNVFNSKYLSTKGGTVAQVNLIDVSEIFSLDSTDNFIDGARTYVLMSAAAEPKEASYWQYVDYGSKTFDATTPYDGYDWYGYAGLNAEFGEVGTAQEFTVLPATAFDESDSRSCVAAGKEPSGYVLTAAAKVMDKFYKLGVQGTNAALEPYNEDVAWLFYEATPVQGATRALEIALEMYGNLEMTGGTAPGYYSQDAVDEYNAAVDQANSAMENGDDDVKRAATAALMDAGEKEYATIPITDGYYYIVTAGKGNGYSGGPYDYENKAAMFNAEGKVNWGPFSDSETKYVYYFTADLTVGDSWMVKNIADNSFIQQGASTYATNISTSDGAAMAQKFTWVKEGKFAMTWGDNRYVYAMAASHNGSDEASGLVNVWGTPAEAGNYGINLWYLVPCSQEMIERITGLGGIAAGGNGAAVEAGKGKVTVVSSVAQTITVVSASGMVVSTQKVEAGEAVTINLVPGIYIVNGQKVSVK